MKATENGGHGNTREKKQNWKSLRGLGFIRLLQKKIYFMPSWGGISVQILVVTPVTIVRLVRVGLQTM
jgi:hypothetical protein